MSNSNYYISSFAWTALSKVISAGLKFVSIPFLLAYFGKDGYGLIALALSINAYVQLMDMGMNTGVINYFSKWIQAEQFDKLNKVFKSNLTFYTVIGLINSSVLLCFANFGQGFFNISANEFLILKKLLYVLASLSIFNWVTFVFTQMLIANEKMVFTQQILFVKNILSLLNVFATINFQWTLTEYLIVEALLNSMVVLPYFIAVRKIKFVSSIYPSWYWKEFKVVFYYGLSIFAMSFFQFSASQSRPLILAKFAEANVTSILSQYKILEVFPLFILSIGSSMISIFLPKTSKAIDSNDVNAIDNIAYNGTKYTSIIVAFLCFPIIINSADLLEIYVGKEYRHLSIWLVIWLLTLVSYLYNSPISSLVLSTGKTRMLVFSSAIACFISIIANILLVDKYAVGSAILGYAVYIGIQMSFYYFYFNKNVLKLNSFKIFKAFFYPTVLAVVVSIMVNLFTLSFNNLILLIIFKALIWFMFYLLVLIFFKIIDIKFLFNKFLNK